MVFLKFAPGADAFPFFYYACKMKVLEPGGLAVCIKVSVPTVGVKHQVTEDWSVKKTGTRQALRNIHTTDKESRWAVFPGCSY